MTDEVEQRIVAARLAAIGGLASAGDWLSGEQRLAAWRESRSADIDPLDRARRQALSPNAVEGSHGSRGPLSASAVEVVHRIASDPGRLSRSWADDRIADLGADVYTELVGVVATVRTLDTFDVAIGNDRIQLPDPEPGPAEERRPDGVGDVGAWVPQSIEKLRANVSRALSLVPRTNNLWRELVDSHYSRGAQFMTLTWERALTRVQVEAVAARTTIALDCFY